jgi:diguanylate cyclase (GGDEF)-like protein/PAS domain S-box-containing protein
MSTPDLQSILIAAERLANGELAARTGATYDESDIGRLAAAIDALADNIQAHRRHIEQLTRQHRRSLRAHHVLSASNRALLRAEEELAELQEVCRLIVEVGNYPFAWIGYAEQDERKTLRPMAHHGLTGEHLYESGLTWDDRGSGMGAAGIAIRTGQPTLIRNAQQDTRMEPWWDSIRHSNLNTVLALPLQLDESERGVLVIWSSEADAFDQEEIKLLMETGDDLTFAVKVVRARHRQQQVEAAFRRVSHQNALILQAAAEGIYVVDTTGTIQFVNPAATIMLGYSEAELLGRNSHGTIHHTRANGQPYPSRDCPISAAINMGSTIRRVQETFWRKDGTPIQVEVSSTPILDQGELQGAVVMVTDISERARYMAQIERKSNFDDLTGLPNRNLLTDRLRQAIERTRQGKHLLAILVINLNHFRNIIDSLGHSIGDQVLQAVARRLAELEGETDTLARAGGDEFVWAIEIRNEDQAAMAARNALEVLGEPMDIAGREVFISASIGISIYPRDGEDDDTLLKNATTAMHRAKVMVDQRYNFYTTEMNARSLERLDMENALRRALDNGELVLHYQPQVDLATGEIIGAETLLRWRHPQRGMVSPAEFVPLAEVTGMIVPIGEWVLRTACSQNRKWQKAGLPPITVAVNISARQLDAYDIAWLADEVLTETGLDPRFLELELTESMIMSDPDAFIKSTRRLKEMGASLSVDDFGTGYSSLNHLKRFAINRLKIDQSFVRDITHDPNAAAITLAIMALARSMKMYTIAEGVENAAQVAFLRRHGCNEIQGYYFSRPVPAEDFEVLLREQRRLDLPAIQHTPDSLLVVVGGAPDLLKGLHRVHGSADHALLMAENCIDGMNLLAHHEAGVVVADARQSQPDAMDFLSRVKEMYPETVRIAIVHDTMLPAVSGTLQAEEAHIFISHPWEVDTLRETIETAFRHFSSQHYRIEP